MPHPSFNSSPTHIRGYRPGLRLEIETILEALAGLEARYEEDRERLMAWPDPRGVKEAFLEQRDARHARERQPLIQRLAYLQRMATTTKLLGQIASLH